MTTLLVVEDDEEVRSSLQEVLEEDEFDVVTAADGQAALDLLRSGDCHPDIILLDLMMPRMDGRGFLREKSTIPNAAHTPVVLVTASNAQFARAAAAEAPEGVALILQKPFSVEQLMRVLTHARRSERPPWTHSRISSIPPNPAPKIDPDDN